MTADGCLTGDSSVAACLTSSRVQEFSSTVLQWTQVTVTSAAALIEPQRHSGYWYCHPIAPLSAVYHCFHFC